jgi:hypothetical protein
MKRHGAGCRPRRSTGPGGLNRCALIDPASSAARPDATKPLARGPLEFKRIHLKGVETLDLASVLQQDTDAAFARIVAN